MNKLQAIEKLFNDSLKDYREAESETAKRIAKNNLRLVGKMLANLE